MHLLSNKTKTKISVSAPYLVSDVSQLRLHGLHTRTITLGTGSCSNTLTAHFAPSHQIQMGKVTDIYSAVLIFVIKSLSTNQENLWSKNNSWIFLNYLLCYYFGHNVCSCCIMHTFFKKGDGAFGLLDLHFAIDASGGRLLQNTCKSSSKSGTFPSNKPTDVLLLVCNMDENVGHLVGQYI